LFAASPRINPVAARTANARIAVAPISLAAMPPCAQW
jgi:hypothetical protein